MTKGGKGGPEGEEGGGRGKFDRVLVDAECTHDGSVKHVAKLGECHASTTNHQKTQKRQLKKPCEAPRFVVVYTRKPTNAEIISDEEAL